MITKAEEVVNLDQVEELSEEEQARFWNIYHNVGDSESYVEDEEDYLPSQEEIDKYNNEQLADSLDTSYCPCCGQPY